MTEGIKTYEQLIAEISELEYEQELEFEEQRALAAKRMNAERMREEAK